MPITTYASLPIRTNDTTPLTEATNVFDEVPPGRQRQLYRAGTGCRYGVRAIVAPPAGEDPEWGFSFALGMEASGAQRTWNLLRSSNYAGKRIPSADSYLAGDRHP